MGPDRPRSGDLAETCKGRARETRLTFPTAAPALATGCRRACRAGLSREAGRSARLKQVRAGRALPLSHPARPVCANGGGRDTVPLPSPGRRGRRVSSAGRGNVPACPLKGCADQSSRKPLATRVREAWSTLPFGHGVSTGRPGARAVGMRKGCVRLQRPGAPNARRLLGAAGPRTGRRLPGVTSSHPRLGRSR